MTASKPTFSASEEAQVSIIMPAYNAAHTLAKTVATVQEQTYRNWLLYIIDDASTDETHAVIADLAKTDDRIRHLTLPTNSGAAIARNTGIQATDAPYIAFLDADDLWAPEKLSQQVAFMQRTGSVFSFTGYWRGGKHGQWRYVPAREKVDRAELLRSNVIGCLTVMLDTNALGTIEMPDLKRRQDYAMWLKLLERTPYAHGIDEAMAGYVRHGSGSLSGGFWTAQRANWWFFRSHLKQPPMRAARSLMTHIAKKGIWALRAKSRFRPAPWLSASGMR